MDLNRFDSANIRFCCTCAKPFYSDSIRSYFNHQCLLCDTIVDCQKKKFKLQNINYSKYELLKDRVKFVINRHNINSILGTQSYPIEDSIGQTHQHQSTKTDWEYMPVKKINAQISEFDKLQYFTLNRIYSEHNLYEYVLLSNMISRFTEVELLRANMSKYYFSLFRYSTLNPPNLIQLETKLKYYNSKIPKNNPLLTETRKEHIEKHLSVPVGQVINGKTSCKPWIRSTNFSRAIHEINRFIADHNSPSECVTFRTVSSLLQVRVYYRLNPVLILIINDIPTIYNRLESFQKPYLVTCYTSNNLLYTLEEMHLNTKGFANLIPDFMGGIEV
jgi:hypothetical protein